jgi:signal transduction histidine kinase
MPADPKKINFTVDSALLQELGERLVGQAHIALAELIKNSYDADASLVEVTVEDKEIEVVDDGHGMDLDAFRSFWMRIGSPHKNERRESPGGRSVTGSKGVGRLSAQFLADQIELTTKADSHKALKAEVDWRRAVKAKDLTKATAEWQFVANPSFAGNASHGTRIRLLGAKQEWDADSLRRLGRELWPLQPPFADQDAESGFRVVLAADDEEAEREFDEQMRAVLRLWDARITGSITQTKEGSGVRKVRLQFRDDTIIEHEEDVPDLKLQRAEFEIRVFSLHNRQPYGIKVEQARQYLREFGGVHVYDADFHLPYYGSAVDWLEIEQDHAHRLSRSKLLPDDLQVPEGMNFLPTNSRLYGAVQIDTGAELSLASEEQKRRGQVLSIQISRDRLIDNLPYRQLRDATRWAIDHWAMAQAQREWSDAPDKTLPEQTRLVEDILDQYGDSIPRHIRRDLEAKLRKLAEAAQSEAQHAANQVGLLGSLATAGMSAIAVEHETARQLAELDRLAKELRRYAKAKKVPELSEMADELAAWATTNRQTRSLFSAFMDEESRESIQRLNAKATIDRTVRQAAPLLRGMTVVSSAVDPQLMLPPGRYAEWTAIFQNVLVNAANASLDASKRQIDVSSTRTGRNIAIHVQDTGSGIDLASSEELFAPFARQQVISEDRRNLGAGGTGLGLTIVRMIARNLDCRVAFVEPDPPFATSFEISWRTQ